MRHTFTRLTFGSFLIFFSLVSFSSAPLADPVHDNKEAVTRALQMNTGELKTLTTAELWKALVLLAEQPELFSAGYTSRVTDRDAQGALIRTIQYEGKTYQERVTFDPSKMSITFANMATGQSATRIVDTQDPKNPVVQFTYIPSTTTKTDQSWNKLQDTHNHTIVDFFNNIPRLRAAGYLSTAHETDNISRVTYQIIPTSLKLEPEIQGIKIVSGTLTLPQNLDQAKIKGVLHIPQNPHLAFSSTKAVALSESINFFTTVSVNGKNVFVSVPLEYKGSEKQAGKNRIVFRGKAVVEPLVLSVVFEAEKKTSSNKNK